MIGEMVTRVPLGSEWACEVMGTRRPVELG